jgi:hypothetical protein
MDTINALEKEEEIDGVIQYEQLLNKCYDLYLQKKTDPKNINSDKLNEVSNN